jgi:hypothetical protein
VDTPVRSTRRASRRDVKFSLDVCYSATSDNISHEEI